MWRRKRNWRESEKEKERALNRGVTRLLSPSACEWNDELLLSAWNGQGKSITTAISTIVYFRFPVDDYRPDQPAFVWMHFITPHQPTNFKRSTIQEVCGSCLLLTALITWSSPWKQRPLHFACLLLKNNDTCGGGRGGFLFAYEYFGRSLDPPAFCLFVRLFFGWKSARAYQFYCVAKIIPPRSFGLKGLNWCARQEMSQRTPNVIFANEKKATITKLAPS